MLFISSMFAASFNMPLYKSVLMEVNENEGYGIVLDSSNLVVGSSGVVVHTFNNGESSIIARGVVEEKKEGRAKIIFEVFGGLSQPALPIPGVLPRVGDEVVLNFLYDRALIVAPNEDIYNQIVASFPNVKFIHPDIMGAYLNSYSTPNPDRDDFRKMCAANAVGLIFIALDGKAVFADCGSFKILKEFQSSQVQNYQVPFYSRIYGIKPAWWKWNSSYIGDYNSHYKYLLDIKE
ncbi:MAG: hypothetical protein GXZ15_00685 [Campylobacter sp.]|nr:hypothetical protein [Campylobacter sp.]